MEKIYEKYKKTKNKYIYEIVLQWYLIQKKERNIALVQTPNSESLTPIKKFMDQNKINYKILDSNKKNDKYRTNIIIYKNTFNIDNFDEGNQKRFGELLGKFYTCAANNLNNNNHRIVIIFNNVEIYAQMCKKKNVINDFEHFYKIYLKTKKIFNSLDKSIFGKIEIYEEDPVK